MLRVNHLLPLLFLVWSHSFGTDLVFSLLSSLVTAGRRIVLCGAGEGAPQS